MNKRVSEWRLTVNLLVDCGKCISELLFLPDLHLLTSQTTRTELKLRSHQLFEDAHGLETSLCCNIVW